MCKGGSTTKQTDTTQQQFAETEQFGYSQANPEAWLPAVQAITNATNLTRNAFQDPSTLVAQLNPWQIEAGLGMKDAWNSAQPQYDLSDFMTREGFGLTQEGAQSMRDSQFYRDKGAIRSEVAADYARRAGEAVNLQDLDVDRYLNPYADYALEGLNESLFGKNKKNQGAMTRLMGGIGGDRISVAEAENLRQDNLARGQLMAGFHRDATGVAQQQQGARYASDVGNRDASGRVSEAFRALAGQEDSRAGQLLQEGQGLIGAGGAQRDIARSYADLASMARDSRVQGLMSVGRWGDMYQKMTQANLDAPWKANQYLTQNIAGLAPVIGGFQYNYGTQSSSGEAHQTTTTTKQQDPFSMLTGLALMGVGAYTGNPMLMQGGASAFSGNKDSGGSEPEKSPFASSYGYYARGGKVKASPYDVGGLVFDPELSDELYPVDKESKEFSDLVFNPEQNVYELPPNPEPQEPQDVPERTYMDRVHSGEAPDYREALLKHGEGILSAPGNENYLNRNLSPYVPPEEPEAPGTGIAAINRAAPMAAPMALPSRATSMAVVQDTPPPAQASPYRVAQADKRPIEEVEEEIIRDQLTKRRPPPEEPPPLPEVRRRKPQPRNWSGVDGRLFELGLRLLAGTADTDRNGIPNGFAANLGKAGLGVLDSERKHRDEQRKDADYDIDDIKTKDAMQKWRYSGRETNRRHEIDDDTRRLNAVQRSQTARENREIRREREERAAEDRRRRLELDEYYKRQRVQQIEEDQRRKREALENQRVRTEIAKQRLERGDLQWMGQDKDGNAILYDKRRRDENGQVIVERVPIGEILPRPRARPSGTPSAVEVQQEARRLAEMDARYRDIKPTDMTAHMQEVLPRYVDMVRTMWGLQGGPAPPPDNRPSSTPQFRSGQDKDLATEVARLKNMGKQWPEIERFLKSQGVDPGLYRD